MAKTPKVKKREVSIHSRAARRNASPPAKGLSASNPATETEYKPWLHNAQNAGINKKRKVKGLTRQQRIRQQKGVEKADAIESKLEKKVKDSKSRAKKIRGRAVDWDDLNEELEGKKKDSEKRGTESGQMGDVVVPDLEQPLAIRSAEVSGAEEVEKAQRDIVTKVPGTAYVPLPVPEDDEIL